VTRKGTIIEISVIKKHAIKVQKWPGRVKKGMKWNGHQFIECLSMSIKTSMANAKKPSAAAAKVF
jgi:hypothetical protein